MAITKSAKKAIRVSRRKKVFNDRKKKIMKDEIKNIEKLSKASKVTKESLASAYKAIDKAVKRGIMKKNTASRRKSKIAKMAK